MNILYLKYAVEVADCGTMNKAADKLYVAQPNLSRAIKELERELGITIFIRNKQGMTLTPDGEKLIAYGRDILRRIDETEAVFRDGGKERVSFSVSVPRASYVSYALAHFTENLIDGATCEIRYDETDTRRTINNVLVKGYGLGVVRYASAYDRFYKEFFDSKGLVCELVAEFRHFLVTNKNGKFATGELDEECLSRGLEIALTEYDAPAVAASDLMGAGPEKRTKNKVLLSERASAFDILALNPEAYAWVDPVPPETLSRYGLVEREIKPDAPIYRDVVIYKKGYRLTELDKAFITELCAAKRKFVAPTG